MEMVPTFLSSCSPHQFTSKQFGIFHSIKKKKSLLLSVVAWTNTTDVPNYVPTVLLIRRNLQKSAEQKLSSLEITRTCPFSNGKSFFITCYSSAINPSDLPLVWKLTELPIPQSTIRVSSPPQYSLSAHQ